MLLTDEKLTGSKKKWFFLPKEKYYLLTRCLLMGVPNIFQKEAA